MEFEDFKDRMDIFCTASPYDAMTYKYYRLEYLYRYCLSIFFNYAFSALSFVHNVVRTPFMNKVWKVFLDTNENMDDVKNIQQISGMNAVVSGYIKMDGMKNVKKIERSRKRVIIAPHHTVMGWSKLNISHFIEYHEYFLQLPLIFPEVDFVFRPHPLLFTNLRNYSLWTEKQIADYRKCIDEIPNMYFDETGFYFNTFINSDALIHDCGSFIGEYLFTENPCCYMLKDRKQLQEGFLDIGRQCINHHYHAYTSEEITEFIRRVVIKGDDPMAESRKTFVREKLKINYPDVAEFVLGYLKKQLNIGEEKS